MNPAINSFLNRIHENGLEAGLITNGALLNDETIDTILKTCRWIGISLDAGTNETFMKVKGLKNEKMFSTVLRKLRQLCDRKKELECNCSICAKYLMHPANVHDIVPAIKLARRMGGACSPLPHRGRMTIPETSNIPCEGGGNGSPRQAPGSIMSGKGDIGNTGSGWRGSTIFLRDWHPSSATRFGLPDPDGQ